jgi:hypothetical protein
MNKQKYLLVSWKVIQINEAFKMLRKFIKIFFPIGSSRKEGKEENTTYNYYSILQKVPNVMAMIF